MKTGVLRYFRALAIAASTVVSAAALAGGASGIQQVEMLSLRNDGTVTASGVDGAWLNPDGCSNSTWVALSVLHPYYREIYAMLLTAHTTRGEVRFFLSGCLNVYGTLYPEIKAMWTD